MIPNVKPNVLPNVLPNVTWDYGAPVATITHTRDGLWESLWRGADGKKLYFNWGDGSAVSEITLLSGSNVSADHTYSGAGPWVISISGDLKSVLTIAAYTSTSITALAIAPMLNGEKNQFWFQGNLLSDISSLVGFIFGVTSFTLRLTGNPVVYTGYTWATQTKGTYYFNSTVTASGEVDQWLIDLAAAAWGNCTVYLDGTNPARTVASDAAVAALVLAGCTLHLN